jgi:hypothetical protein
MHTTQILTLLLALSTALNVAFAVGLTAFKAGTRPGLRQSQVIMF